MTDRRWWTDNGDGRLYLSADPPPPIPEDPMDVPNFRCIVTVPLEPWAVDYGDALKAYIVGPGKGGDPLEAEKAAERASAKPGEWCDLHDDWQVNCGQDAEACWQDEQDARREREEELRMERGYGW